MRPPPRWFALPVALLGGLVALWGLVGVALAVALPQTSVWTLAGFELVVAVAGVLGLFLGLGYFRQGPGLALACVAGTVLVASFLGHRGTAGVLGTFSLNTWLLARLGVGLTLGGLAALVVLTRNRGSWPSLLIGIGFGAVPAIVALMLGLASIGYGRAPAPSPVPVSTTSENTSSLVAAPTPTRQPAAVDKAVREFMGLGVFRPQKGGLEAGRIVLLTVLGIVLLGLTSAGVHYVIRAFQLGSWADASAAPARPKGSEPTAGASPPAGASAG